jgi:hypothetical protein
MPKYMLLMYHPADQSYVPSAEVMKAERPKWAQFAQDLNEAGAFVSNHGLQGPDAATTVRVRDGQAQITDGPFAETKELLAGYFVIEAADLDGALEWAQRIPSVSYGAVEIRPVWG